MNLWRSNAASNLACVITKQQTCLNNANDRAFKYKTDQVGKTVKVYLLALSVLLIQVYWI